MCKFVKKCPDQKLPVSDRRTDLSLNHETGVTVLKCSIHVKKIVPRDLEIWWMTLKNNRAPLLYHIKLCAAFHSHWHIKIGVTVRKRSLRVKIDDFLSHVTQKIDGWPWKTISHAPLLYFIKFCASFQIHRWSQTSVTVRKRWIWVKIGDFLLHVTMIIVGWHWKTKGQLSYATSSFVHHFKAIVEIKLVSQPGNAEFGSKSTTFLAVWLKFHIWPWKNNSARCLKNIELCASFHRHMWIQTGATARKQFRTTNICPEQCVVKQIQSGNS